MPDAGAIVTDIRRINLIVFAALAASNALMASLLRSSVLGTTMKTRSNPVMFLSIDLCLPYPHVPMEHYLTCDCEISFCLELQHEC